MSVEFGLMTIHCGGSLFGVCVCVCVCEKIRLDSSWAQEQKKKKRAEIGAFLTWGVDASPRIRACREVPKHNRCQSTRSKTPQKSPQRR